MATEFQFYVSPVELRSDWGPIRPAYVPRVFIYAPFKYEVTLHLNTRNRAISLVGCEPTVHQTIQADSEITKIWPVVSIPWSAVVSHYGTPLTTIYTGPQLTALRNALEAIGFDTGWTTASTSFRDLVRRISRHIYVNQRTDGDNVQAMRDLHGYTLDTTVGTIPSATRTAIAAWMQSKGMATAWITGSTTVRQVLRYIAENWSELPERFGLALDKIP